MKKIMCILMATALLPLCLYGCCSKETKPAESSAQQYITGEEESSDYYTDITSADDINGTGDITLNITSAELTEMGFGYNDFVVFRLRGQSITVAVVPDSTAAGEQTDVLIVGQGDEKAVLSVVGGDFAFKYGIMDQSTGERTVMNDVVFPLDAGFSLAKKDGYRK